MCPGLPAQPVQGQHLRPVPVWQLPRRQQLRLVRVVLGQLARFQAGDDGKCMCAYAEFTMYTICFSRVRNASLSWIGLPGLQLNNGRGLRAGAAEGEPRLLGQDRAVWFRQHFAMRPEPLSWDGIAHLLVRTVCWEQRQRCQLPDPAV